MGNNMCNPKFPLSTLQQVSIAIGIGTCYVKVDDNVKKLCSVCASSPEVVLSFDGVSRDGQILVLLQDVHVHCIPGSSFAKIYFLYLCRVPKKGRAGTTSKYNISDDMHALPHKLWLKSRGSELLDIGCFLLEIGTKITGGQMDISLFVMLLRPTSSMVANALQSHKGSVLISQKEMERGAGA
uniref:Uncharacterized protein n=1 Tax=Solanum lycopersicum TaxID=4081 RepID=A0A3Q7F8G9_SOLLC